MSRWPCIAFGTTVSWDSACRPWDSARRTVRVRESGAHIPVAETLRIADEVARSGMRWSIREDQDLLIGCSSGHDAMPSSPLTRYPGQTCCAGCQETLSGSMRIRFMESTIREDDSMCSEMCEWVARGDGVREPNGDQWGISPLRSRLAGATPTGTALRCRRSFVPPQGGRHPLVTSSR